MGIDEYLNRCQIRLLYYFLQIIQNLSNIALQQVFHWLSGGKFSKGYFFLYQQMVYLSVPSLLSLLDGQFPSAGHTHLYMLLFLTFYIITNLQYFQPLSRQLISLISSKQKQLQSSQQLSFLLPFTQEMSMKSSPKQVSWENLENLCTGSLSKKGSLNESEIVSHIEQQRSKQQIIQQYNQFFTHVSKQIQNRRIQDLSEQTLQKHRIKIIPAKNSHRWKKLINEGSTYVQLFSSGYKGIQCTYHVVISNFLLHIRVLNLDENSLQLPELEKKENVLGQGSYGKVQRLRVNNKNIAIKKIMFPKIKNLKFNLPQIFNSQDYADCYQIRRAISQYCIYKICSMFKIGPEVIFEKSYDLICYNDCIEFEMQVCEEVSAQVPDNSYETDIKKCLGILHSLKIIHKDIKKSNTLWSPSFKSFVLSDFGLSHSVKQNIWEKTQTFFGGSPTYSSPEMKRLLFGNSGSSGLVNLYLNDIHCLKITLQNLKPFKVKNPLPVQVSLSCCNSMSKTKKIYGSQSNEWQYVQYVDDEEKPSFLQQEEQQQYIESDEIYENRIDEGSRTDIIRYYHAKVLYRFLQKNPKQLKIDSEHSIMNFIDQILPQDEHGYDSIRMEIQKILIQDEKKFYSEEFSQILYVRNSVRMFGVSSGQVNKLLKNICQKKAIPNVCYSKIYNYLTASNKNNKIVVKQFKNHIMNMDQHRQLRNRRLFFCSLLKLIHNYLRQIQSQRIEEQKIEILRMGIEALDFQQLTELQFWELVYLLWLLLGKRHNNSKKFQNQQCLRLVERIFTILEKQDKVMPITFGSIVRIHLRCNSQKGAEFYYKKLIQKRESLQSIINGIQKKVIIKTKEEELEIRQQILDHVIYQVAYLQSVNKHQEALNLGKFYYKFITENPVSDQIFTFILLDKIIVSLMQLDKIAQAQEFNQVFSSVAYKLCFPKKNGLQISLQYYTKGLLDYKNKKPREALSNFQKVLQNPYDSLRGANYVKLIKNTLTCMATCCLNLNQKQKALEYLQKNLQMSLQYSQFNQFQQPIQIIHNIIPILLKTNKSKPILVEYFEKLAYLKTQMVNSKRIHLDTNMVRRLQFIPLQYLQSKQEQFGEDNIILIKKIATSIAQQYLPTFQTWYVNACHQICVYYINKINHPSKAIPYCWKIFYYTPKNQRGELIYRMMGVFADLLCRVNSTRKAYKFLKKNIFIIPEELQNLKSESYRKISKYGTELNTNEKQYYNFLWRTKAFRSLYQLGEAAAQLQFIEMKKGEKKVWEKRLKKIRNCLQEEVVVIGDQPISNRSERSHANDAQPEELDIQQQIRIKLRKRNQNRNLPRSRCSQRI